MSYISEVMADLPTVYSPCDEPSASSLMRDGTGQGNAGSWVGSPAVEFDIIGNPINGTARIFDASNDDGPLAANVYGEWASPPFTYELWVLCPTSAPGGTQNIFWLGNSGDSDPEFTFRFNTSGTLTVVMSSDGSGTHLSLTASECVLTDGRWHHIVWTENASRNYTLYYDGKPTRTGSYTPGTTTFNRGRLGVRQTSITTGRFGGRISHFASYTTALTLARIHAHYLAGIGINSRPFSWSEVVHAQPGLVAHYSLDEPSGVVVTGYPATGSYAATGVGYVTGGPSPAVPRAITTDGVAGEIALPTSVTAPFSTTTPQTWMWWQFHSVDVTSAAGSDTGVISRTAANTQFVFGASTSLLTGEVATVMNDAGGVDDRTGWTTFTITAGWRHHCFTYSGAQNGWTYYLDGVATGSKVSNSGGSFGIPSAHQVSFGRLQSGTFVACRVAALSVFMREVSAAQVLKYYQASRSTGFPPGLSVY